MRRPSIGSRGPSRRCAWSRPRGTAFRLTYGAEAGGGTAVGFDRSALDPALLALAERAGATVRLGASVRSVELALAAASLRGYDRGTGRGRPARVPAWSSAQTGRGRIVAQAAGVVRSPALAGRTGLTWHVEDDADAGPRDARMVVLPDGAYCGIAPVPGGRVNIGIVLSGASWRTRLAESGAAATTAGLLARIPSLPGDPEAWRTGRATDAIAGASPLGSRVAHRAGRGWLVVGDAAGFLDPFTGEGLHRALVSARLAAGAIDASLRGSTGRRRRRPRAHTSEPCAAGSRARTSSLASCCPSSIGRRCSSGPRGTSPSATTFVRRWAS